MAKKPCILGSNCPNKIAKRNILCRISDGSGEAEPCNVKASCLFCGTSIKKESSASGKSSSSGSSRSGKKKKAGVGDIDSLEVWRSTKMKDTKESIEELRAQLPIFHRQTSATRVKEEFDEDDDDSFKVQHLFEIGPSESKAEVAMGSGEPTALGKEEDSQESNVSSLVPNDAVKPEFDESLAQPSTSTSLLEADLEFFNCASTSGHSGEQGPSCKDLAALPESAVERLVFSAFKLQFTSVYSTSSEDSGGEERSVKKFPNLDRFKKKRSRRSRRSADAVPRGEHVVGSGFRRRKRRRGVTGDTTPPGSPEDWDTSASSDSSPEYSVGIDHDYSTSEQQRLTEFDADKLARETEDLNWDDTITLDDAPLTPPVITIEDPPVVDLAEMQRVAEQSRVSPIVVDSDSDHSSHDHTYVVREEAGGEASDDTVDYSVPDPVPKPPAARKTAWECPICLEPSSGQEVSTTTCGHVFCKECIEAYVATCSACPTCRTHVNKAQIITLFNLF